MFHRNLVRRFLVIVLLAGLGLGGWRIWRASRPEYLWAAAQKAVSNNDRASARLYLQNLLKKQPQQADAYLLLARLELEEASTPENPATFATQPRALRYLSEGAKLKPGDVTLQHDLLNALLKLRRIREGAVVAERILAAEPNDLDALYIATYHAVESKNLKAAGGLIERLQRAPSHPVFETLGFEVQFAIDSENAAAQSEALDRFSDAVAALAEGALNHLTVADNNSFEQLLVLDVSHTDEVGVATQRCKKILAGLEKGYGENSGQAALHAERLWLTLAKKYPSAEGVIVPSAETSEIAELVSKLRKAALASGEGITALWIRAAQDELLGKNYAQAFEIITQGLTSAAEQKLDSKNQEVAQLHLMAAQLLMAAGKSAEAQPHAEQLLQNSALAGWGHLILGNVLLNGGRCDAAEAEFHAAERKLGATLLVRAALAQTYLMEQKYSDALPLLNSLHVRSEDLSLDEREWAKEHLGNGARLHFDELRAHLALNQWDKAKSHLSGLSGTDLEPRAWSLIVGYWLDRNQPEEAMRWLGEGRSRFPKSLELIWIDASAKFVSGKTEAARDLLATFAADNPKNIGAQLLICRWRMEHGEAASAAEEIALIRRRQDLNPEEHEVLALLEAQALAIAGQPEQALAELAPLSARPETAASAGMVAAAVQASHKNWKGVQEALAEAQKISPQFQQLSLFAGEYAALQGDYRAAIESLGPALDVTILRQRAATALQQAISTMTTELGPSAALAKVDELIKQYPHDASLRVMRANLAIQIGDLEGALAALDHLEQLDAASSFGAYYRATTLAAAGQLDRALTEARRGVKLNSSHVPSLLLVAELELKLNRPQAALTATTAATKLDPTSCPGFLLQAESLHRLGRTTEARDIYKNLVEHTPTFAPGHVGLASLLASSGDLSAALLVCETALRTLPGDLTVQSCQVSLLCQSGDAAKALDVARQTCGKPVDGRKALAFAQVFLGTQQNAIADEFLLMAANATNQPARAAASTTLGMHKLSAGMKNSDHTLLSAAAEHFRAALAADPDQLLAANNLAWLLASRLEQVSEAVQVVDAIQARHASERLSPELLDTIAIVYRAAHRNHEAAELMEKVIPVHPTDARLFYQLGLAQLDDLHADACRESLTQALRLGLKGERAEKAQEILSRLSDLAENTANKTASAN